MAKLQDKLYNRTIVGKIELEDDDNLGLFSEDLKLKAYKTEIPNLQATATVVVNPLTNLNGRELTAYTSQYVSELVEYPYYLIQKGGNKLSFSQAEEYMEYMTGSKYVPLFNYEKPKNSIWIMADGRFLKPQYDEENGIRLFVLPNPFTATYSLAELDFELRQILQNAINDGGVDGVDCTQAQWNFIKALLDKSLYFYYQGYSMIKTITNGIDKYGFGGVCLGDDYGATLFITYEDKGEGIKLYATFMEV